MESVFSILFNKEAEGSAEVAGKCTGTTYPLH